MSLRILTSSLLLVNCRHAVFKKRLSSPQLVKHLKSKTVLERDMGGVSRLYKKKYTPKERIKRATNWIDKHGVITLQEYATLNNLSRTSASGELKKLSHGNEAPFESKGKGSHKVWVKAGWQQ